MRLRHFLVGCAVATGMLLSAVALANEHEEKTGDKAMLLKASQTTGMEVQNKQGKNLGEISDLVANLEQGAVTHILVSSGGFLGIGDRVWPIPLSAAKFKKEKENDGSFQYALVVDLREKDVERAPALSGDSVSDLEQDQWAKKLNRFYRTSAQNALSDAGEGDLMRCSDLIGKELRNDAGEEELGSVNNLVFAADDGKIRYVALSFGGFLGVGDKLFAVPWESLAFTKRADEPSETQLTLTSEVSKERLSNLKGFDQDNWPREAEAGWASRTAKKADGSNRTVR